MTKAIQSSWSTTPSKMTERTARRSLVPPSSPFRTPIKTSSRKQPRSGQRAFTSPRYRSMSKNPTPLSPTSGDRFIPNRRKTSVDQCRRALLAEDDRNDNERRRDNDAWNEEIRSSATDTVVQKEFKRHLFSSLCDVPLESVDNDAKPKSLFGYGPDSSKKQNRPFDPYSLDHLRVLQQFETTRPRSLSSGRNNRKVPEKPRQVLDAPGMVDDYYLNLISWNKENIVAVLISNQIYLWNGNTGAAEHLGSLQPGVYGTSVAWCTFSDASHILAVGTSASEIQIWDTEQRRIVRMLYGHTGRISSLAWNQNWLSSGGQDSKICQHDLMTPNQIVATYQYHEMEVCGLKWNEAGSLLASGGNDNLVCIWDATMSAPSSLRRQRQAWLSRPESASRPRLALEEHTAAVKALDWCPFRRDVLASGGGTADRTIKFWNVNNGNLLNSTDTGSQVCSLVWSAYQNEICSAHGFSKNELVLWKYGNDSSLTKVGEMTGHSRRVLNLARSPDGATVLSVSADETICFWDVFGEPPSIRSSDSLAMSKLTFGMPTIR